MLIMKIHKVTWFHIFERYFRCCICEKHLLYCACRNEVFSLSNKVIWSLWNYWKKCLNNYTRTNSTVHSHRQYDQNSALKPSVGYSLRLMKVV